MAQENIRLAENGIRLAAPANTAYLKKSDVSAVQ